jgi:WD40 repeat protein
MKNSSRGSVPRRLRTSERVFTVAAAFLLLLACAVQSRAQGSPDVVWQGQHTGFLRYTAFTPDGQLLVSGGDDRTNKVWQVSDGTLLRTITQCSGVGCAGSTFGFVSPDGQTLLTSGLRFWRISDGTLQRRLGIGGNLALSPDWQYIVSSSFSSSYPGNETRTTTLFRLSDGSQVWTKPDGGGQVAFSPDGQTVAAVGFQGIDIWRVSDGALVGLIPGPRTLYAFSPDGQLVVTSGGADGAFRYDTALKFYRVSDGALVRSMPGVGVVTSAAFTPDGQTLIASSWEPFTDPANGYVNARGSIRFWRVSDGTLLKTYDQTTGQFANAVNVSPDGKLFSYTYDSTVVVARMPSFQCTYQISPGRADLPASGGGGSVSVSAPAGCGWKAASHVSWLNITSGGTGDGNGTVNYQTTTGGNDLTGLLVIAEQSFTVHLGDPSCTYTVSNNGTSFSPPGGSGTLGVSTATACGWGVKSNADWITITDIKGDSGPTGVTYSVAPNSGPPRSGTISIAGQTVTVNQGTDPCSYSAAPVGTTSFDSYGGTKGVSVAATNHCPWTASTDADWVTLQTTSGSGNLTVVYSVSAKATPGSRTGHVTVAGQTITIFQTGITCDYSISPPNRYFTNEGGSAYVNVSAQSACGWTATSNADWITVTSGTPGAGIGTVYYSVAPFNGTSPRTGTITLAGGLTFTVWQGTEPLHAAPDIVWTGTGHTASANAVAFSPDGQLLASGGSDKVVKVWRVSDGSPVTTLAGFTDRVTSVAFSHDGSKLAAGSTDRTVKVWNVADWSLARAVNNTDFILGLAFSPDDSLLAEAGGYSGNSVHVLRTSDWQQVSLLGYGQENRAVAYSPDGHFLAFAQLYPGVQLANLSNGAVWTLEDFGYYGTTSLAFSPDSQTLASGSDDQSVSLWRISDGAQLFSLNGPSGLVKGVAFSPDGRTVLAGGQDTTAGRGTLIFWRASDGALLRAYVGQTSTAVLSVQYSPDGSLYAYARADGAVVLARNPFASTRAAPPPPAPPSPRAGYGDIDPAPPPSDGTIGPDEDPPPSR